jgi:uncharacterized protein YdhG (YjbR/CyaY superfamily)
VGQRSPAIDHYLKHTPATHRHAFEVIRDLLHRVQPDVRESVQYNMPLFDHHGLLCGFASQPHLISLYCKAEIVERYRHKLGNINVGRGCIRFQKLDDVPLDVLYAIFVDTNAALEQEFAQSARLQKGDAMTALNTIHNTVAPELYYQGRQLITAPSHYGVLRDSRTLLGQGDRLRERMAEDGYLYLPEVLDPEAVEKARISVLLKLQAEGALDPNYPLEAGIIAPDVHFSFRPDLANGNPVIQDLLYTGKIMQVMAEFLGGPVLHYDFTWLRAKAPGPNTATTPHCDIVFMSRGTKQLYTVWTPLSDVSYKLGGLLVLENSHRKPEHLGEYWEFDVDTYCVNDQNDEAHERWAWGKGGGSFSKDAIGVRQELGGRWLSAEYKAGDILIFSMFTLHASLDNRTNQVRLSTDSRYQLAGEAVDERWIGENPIAHGPDARKELIC